MKAVIYERYGAPDVLTLQDIDKPVPKSDEVLIKVYATSVTAGDWRMRKADPFLTRLFNGLFKPKRVKILGFELAGVIEEVGKEVRTFKAGDAVFAFCGYKFGGYAEYRCLRETDVIALKPFNMTFEQAATVPLGSLTALSRLRKGKISEGQKVLIYGASGSVGTFAIQLAKYFGAEITAVCSTNNTELARSIGADKTVDYKKEDFTALEEKFDLIFDAVGKIKKSDSKKLLKPTGSFISVNGQTKPTQQDLILIKEIIEAGKLTSIIDRTYNLNEIQDAHRYVEQFRKKGNVSVRVAIDEG
ncbi:NAD(P)-dependent alcohol dehydrogenase [Pontibacter pudoricolor]|uniref:NAD(P)-dependent alcohol dehydrogenase n=1 Tax=Pontibacter pudoricolor TaxID=2694930 RepID=UPI0013908E9A|nr:NAD(P)-dependent alcohol dehydrogenase [Pontibacter pudoricolor]